MWIDRPATVIARVKRVTKRQTRRRQSMVTITLYDGSGYLDLTFFNQPWTGSTYKEGYEVAVSGIAQHGLEPRVALVRLRQGADGDEGVEELAQGHRRVRSGQQTRSFC